MRGIATPPRPSASSGARGLARRLLAGDLPSEPLPRPAPAPDHPTAADGPAEPSNPAKLAEAHAMARRPDHPLHAALMNPIHPHHAHALAAYEELFRQAFAPAKPASKPAAVPGAAAKPAADGWSGRWRARHTARRRALFLRQRAEASRDGSGRDPIASKPRSWRRTKPHQNPKLDRRSVICRYRASSRSLSRR